MMKLFNFLNERFYLTLDRTNWQWGEEHQYFGAGCGLQRRSDSGLLAGVEQKRHSNTRERMALMKRFIQHRAKTIALLCWQTVSLWVKPGSSG